MTLLRNSYNLQQRSKSMNFRGWRDIGSNADVKARKHSNHSKTGYQRVTRSKDFPAQTMNAHRRSKSLTSTLDWGQWSTSRPSRFTPGKEAPCPLNWGLGEPQNRSRRFGEGRNVLALPRIEPGSLATQLTPATDRTGGLLNVYIRSSLHESQRNLRGQFLTSYPYQSHRQPFQWSNLTHYRPSGWYAITMVMNM